MTRQWPRERQKTSVGTDLVILAAVSGLVVNHFGWTNAGHWLIDAGIDVLEGATRTYGY